eukprot:TRINITY_DN5033_c0_g3_i1.p1 TRINITY_DN5033_c0_g3~~TRINITY_DN5033_c0_g3_i1.p1  ORF type:complete len:594 (-),score=195.43 TRINITY_DN5033_c0_g3_i1:172-1953(-)
MTSVLQTPKAAKRPGDAMPTVATKKLKTDDSFGPDGLATHCSACGNKFMEDSKFCRKCGTPRARKISDAEDDCKCEEIGQVCTGARRDLQTALDKANTELARAKRQAADADTDLKLKLKQHKKAVDDVNDAKRQLQAAGQRLSKSTQQLADAESDQAQKKQIFDDAQHELDDADNAYKGHFLPLKGTVKETSGLPWAQSSKRHVDALTPILKEENCEDCLLAGFSEAAKRPPQERSGFCNSTMNEVERLLQKNLNKKKSAVNAATQPLRDADAKLKDATDTNKRAKDAEKRALDDLTGAEGAEQKAKSNADAAEDELAKRNDDVKNGEKDVADRKADIDNFKKLEKELRDLEAKVDDALSKKADLEAAKKNALDRKRNTERDVDRAKDGLADAQKKCSQARAEADKARAAADDAKAKLDDATADSNDFDDLYKKHFLPLKAGKFKNDGEVKAHLDALKPAFRQVDIEPCLLAGFNAASCHTKEERGPFCTKVVDEVGRILERQSLKLKDAAAALRPPYEKAEAEAKRLGALQERACGAGVRDAEANVERRMAADDEAAKGIEKATAALEECKRDLSAKVQVRDKKLDEVKAAC